MSREEFDIPEVFRRAMEEAGWRDGGGGNSGGNGGNGDDDGNNRDPFPSRPSQSPQVNRSFWIFGAILILILSFNWIVNTYTDWLWFTELGYAAVWLKRWSVQIIAFAISFVVATLLLLGNWHLARRRAIRSTPPFNPQFLTPSAIGWLISAVGLFLAFAFASGGAAQWEELLLYINRVPFGTADPIFGRDVSFYLFELPVFEFLQGWFISMLFVTLVGILPIYAINYLPDIQRGNWQPQNFPEFRKHVVVLGTLFLLTWALGYVFDLFGLVYSPRGVVFGATYTDMNASRWALILQFATMLLAAIALFLNYFRFNIRPFLISAVLWLFATLIVGGVYPGLLQRYAVEPNEIERERPYIEYNIDLTRLAFGLDDIDAIPFEDVSALSEDDISVNDEVIDNVRLWDYRPLQRTYEQLQALRPYYQFSEVDIDRYEIDGETRQVMLAARELDKENLPAPSWVNRNLEFTHGYGIVMNPVTEITPDGQPEFYIKDLPPQSTISLEVTQPEIYFGELTNDTVFVSSGREEFSYPSGNENVYTTYQGTGGVPLDSFLKRLAFAIRLGDTNVLLSDEIDAGTRVQFHRQVQNRISQITPFLELDGDPYIVVRDDGSLVWIQDAYTVSNRFPYSTPVNQNGSPINYMRNAAKIVVDAYDGTVDFYLTAPDDPIIQTYDKAFPELFKPFSEFPADLMNHVRYPEDLFSIQALQYLTYHMQDVRVFYNKEDLWEVPLEIFDGEEQLMEPYYVYLQLPDGDEPEYLLIQPFVPAGKNNMIAWMAARNDGERYGERVVYELPKQELVFGPLQVEGRIDQEPEISQQFSLWDQRGSRVIRGNLLVIPLNNSFVYVEPIYLLSDTSALPELKRVIVATDTRIAMRETLEEALLALLLESPAGDILVDEDGTPVIDSDEVDSGEDEGSNSAVTDAPIDATFNELVESANAHFEAAEAAQQAGDWARYGEELEALREDLSRLMAISAEVNSP